MRKTQQVLAGASEFPQAPWRYTSSWLEDASLDNEGDEEAKKEKDLVTRLLHKPRDIEGAVREFLLRDGVIVSYVLERAMSQGLFPLAEAPYPLEAYVAECVAYIEPLRAATRQRALSSLGVVSGDISALCRVALDEKRAWRDVALFASVARDEAREEERREGDGEHKCELAISLWRSHAHEVEELLGRKEGLYTH